MSGTSRPERPHGAGVRADIQGLRAVAVLLVVADHFWGVPAGGFLGVDVFFVLSGFLITGLMLREHGTSGRISFAGFYRRRIRRIIPVATLVLVVTVLATFTLYGEGRAGSVGSDAAWAFLFLANWHFADIGTDYFLSAGPVSPLQHYWSLSVEEQFYVVWPALLVVGLWLAARAARLHLQRVVLPVLVVGVGVASFAWSLHHSVADPTAAYFSTFDRAWELLAGAALAVVAPALVRLPDRVRPALAWAGLAGIAVSVVVVTPESTFPAPWALLPVLGTVLVLAAGCGGPSRVVVLTNPASRYVGDISYSLYLWHFPVIVLVPPVLPFAGVGTQLAALVATFGLAALSFHLVEDPIRHSGWLEPRWRRMLHTGPTNHSHRVANAWLAVGALLVLPLAGMAVRDQAPPVEDTLLAVEAERPTGRGGAAAETEAAHLQRRVEQSLALDAFPTLEPPVTALGVRSWYDQMESTGCLSVTPEEVAGCRFGDPSSPRTALVLGDSHAIAYMPAIRAALGEDYLIQQLTLQECPVWDVPTTHLSGAAYPECASYRPWSWEQVAAIEPDLLIMTTSVRDAAALVSRATGSEALEEVAGGLRRTLEALLPSVGRAVVLASPPGAPDLMGCATRFSTPDDCEGSVSPLWYDVTDVEREVAADLGVRHVDTRGWFCVDSACPGFVGDTPVYADGSHLTLRYATQLGPVLREALAPATRPARDPSS